MALSDMVDAVQSAFGKLREAPARVPTWAPIAADRADERIGEGAVKPRRQYFEVRITRIYLAREREWFTRYSPLLLAGAEFSYDGQMMFTPTVIGPASLERLGGEAPVGGVIANTRVAGPVPFRGDQLGVSVVLYKLERENVAQPFLDALEGAAGAIDLVSGVLPYAKIARVVLSGVAALTGGTKPIVARADQFSPPEYGFYALVDAEAKVPVDSLAVSSGELYVDGRPFRDGDYVLYSIRDVKPEMIDVSRLPLYRQWQATLLEAGKSATDEIWKSTKINFATLVGMLDTSPDLTADHAFELEQEWQAAMVARHERALARADLAEQASPLDSVRSRALDVLDL